MTTIRQRFDNFCLALSRRVQIGLVAGGFGVMFAGMLVAPFFTPAGVAADAFSYLIALPGVLVAMSTMLMGVHAIELRERARLIAWQKRDLDHWAVELVNKEPTVDVLELQKALDLRQMEIDCQELDDSVWDIVDEDLTHPELDALQRAVDQRAAKEMNGW